MNLNLLEILVCPSCKGSLRLFFIENGDTDKGRTGIDPIGQEVISGLMECGCGSLYPIIEGVPRLLDGGINCFPAFIEQHRQKLERVCGGQHLQIHSVATHGSDDYENIRKSFSQEWGIFDYDHDKTWGWTLDERKQVFLEDVKMKPEEVAGKHLLDAGCGNGTLSAALSDFDLEVVGLDLNDGLGLANRNRAKYARRAKWGVQYVQGNLVQPPLKENTFDLVYSSGVIHHTPSSKDAFESLSRLVKKGGRLYVWVYGKRALPVRMFFSSGRYLKRWLSLRSLLQICRLLAPFYKTAAAVLNGLNVMKFRSRTTREITLDLFDAFAPRYNHWHSEAEVRSWFENHGFQNINVSGRQKHGFGMYGDRT